MEIYQLPPTNFKRILSVFVIALVFSVPSIKPLQEVDTFYCNTKLLFLGGNLNTKLWKVKAGDHYRTIQDKDGNETEHKVKKIITHPDFGERLIPHDMKKKIYNAKYDIGKYL